MSGGLLRKTGKVILTLSVEGESVFVGFVLEELERIELVLIEVLIVLVRSSYRTPYFFYSDLHPTHVGGLRSTFERVGQEIPIGEVGGKHPEIPYPGTPYLVPRLLFLSERRVGDSNRLIDLIPERLYETRKGWSSVTRR